MRILHTMLRVTDLEKSIAFYQSVMGMQLLRRTERPEQAYTLAYLGYGGNPAQAELELTYNWGVSSYEAGTAYGHIAVGVEDIQQTCGRIARMGGRILREPAPVKGGYEVIAFIEDPDGYKIELIERDA